MSSIMEFMSKDHDKLDGIFKEFQSLKKTDKAKKLFSDFDAGLRMHITWEEEILFPIFEEKTGMKDEGPTQVMREEHKQIKEFLGKINDKVAENGETDEFENGLLEVLTQHNDKEENILYPMIDDSLNEKEREEVLEKINSLSEK